MTSRNRLIGWWPNGRTQVIINVLCLLGIHCEVRNPYGDNDASKFMDNGASSPALGKPACNLNGTLWMNCGTPDGALRCALSGTTCRPDCQTHTYNEWCEQHCSCADHKTGSYAITNPVELPALQPNHDDVEVKAIKHFAKLSEDDADDASTCEFSCINNAISTFCKMQAGARCKDKCVLSVMGFHGPSCAALCSCTATGASEVHAGV